MKESAKELLGMMVTPEVLVMQRNVMLAQAMPDSEMIAQLARAKEPESNEEFVAAYAVAAKEFADALTSQMGTQVGDDE